MTRNPLSRFTICCLLAAATLVTQPASAAEPKTAADEQKQARDEIVRHYGSVHEMHTSDGTAFAIELPEEIEDAALLAPFSPIAELALAPANAASALARSKASTSLRALTIDEPTDEVLKLVAEVKPLRTLWLSAADEPQLSGETLELLAPLTQLSGLGLDGYQLSESGVQAVARFTSLERLSLVGGIEGDGLKPLAALAKLKELAIDDYLDETLDLQSLGKLTSLESLSLELPEEQELSAADFDALAALPKLRELDLGACQWNEEDLARLATSRSLRVVACTREIDADEGWGPDDIQRVTKLLAPIRFVAYGPMNNPLAQLKSPQVTAFRLDYEEIDVESDDKLPPLDPAKQYIGDGQVIAERPIEAADLIDKLQKLLGDRESYNNPEAIPCDAPDFAIRFRDQSNTVEVRLCLECHYIFLSESPHDQGLIAQPGRLTRYEFALSSDAANELGTILVKIFAPTADE